MAFHGDFDPRRAPDEIRDSSLWIIEKRGGGGGNSSYHGNFIPEIPYQLMRRYTKAGDVVLDPFAGSGTTLEVGKRLKRHVIASDIFPQHSGIVKSDAEKLDLDGLVDLIILHPPYWDIVQYTYYEEDLSNCCDLEAFLEKMRRIVINLTRFLPPGKFLSIVISDIYTKGELILLPFECARVIKACGYRLKSDVVKNVGMTQGKNFGRGGALWRYRALQNNFCTFAHEHIMSFERI
jgi:hypothetical protein